jgi:hypothetical protein
MAGLAVAAVSGQIPLAITVLMQPTAILFKVALLGLLAGSSATSISGRPATA